MATKLLPSAVILLLYFSLCMCGVVLPSAAGESGVDAPSGEGGIDAPADEGGIDAHSDEGGVDAPSDVEQNLYISNAYHDAGKWGSISICASGSFVSSVELMYSFPGEHMDETAVNGVKLYCTTPQGRATGYVTSSVGKNGQWLGMVTCSAHFITGFRANVLAYQGGFVDDVAVENVEVECNYGREILKPLPDRLIQQSLHHHDMPSKFRKGEWSSYATCRDGLVVCGIQTRCESGSLGDQTSVNDIVLFCCAEDGSMGA